MKIFLLISTITLIFACTQNQEKGNVGAPYLTNKAEQKLLENHRYRLLSENYIIEKPQIFYLRILTINPYGSADAEVVNLYRTKENNSFLEVKTFKSDTSLFPETLKDTVNFKPAGFKFHKTPIADWQLKKIQGKIDKLCLLKLTKKLDSHLAYSIIELVQGSKYYKFIVTVPKTENNCFDFLKLIKAYSHNHTKYF